MTKTTWRVRLIGGATVLSLLSLAAACGDDSDDATSDGTTPSEASDPTPAGSSSTVGSSPTSDESETTSPPDGSSTAATSTETSATTAADADAEASGAFPRTVEHALGLTEIPAPPQRVVTLDMSFVDAAFTLETPTYGYTTFGDSTGELPDYFGAAREAYAAEAEHLGDLMAPNVEAIAELEPDLILSASVRHEDIYDELSAIAPTVMSDSAGAGWKDNLRLTAETLGKEELAEERIAAYEERAVTVGDEVNDAAGDPEVSIVRFVDVVRLYQAASFSGVVFEDAGIARPENQRDTENFIVELSPEELGQADADHVFYTIYNDSEVEKVLQQAMDSGLWEASLSAARDGHAYEVPDETWMSAVGMFGAHYILSDLAETFDVDPHLDLSPMEPLINS